MILFKSVIISVDCWSGLWSVKEIMSMIISGSKFNKGLGRDWFFVIIGFFLCDIKCFLFLIVFEIKCFNY